MARSHSLDDAVLTRTHKRIFLSALGSPFIAGYVLSLIGVVIAQITGELQLSTMLEGLIAAAALLGVFFGGTLGGWITDNFGRKFLYLLNPVLIFVFSVAHMFAETALTLCLLRFIIGVAVGADYPVASTILSEFMPKKYRAPMIGGLVIMWFAGSATAYISGELIMSTWGDESWRMVLAAAAIPCALFFFMRLGSPESPRWMADRGNLAAADQIVKSVYGQQYSINDMPEEEEKKLSLRSLFSAGHGRNMLFVTLFWTCSIIPLYAVNIFAPKVMQALALSGRWASLGSIMIMLLFVVGSMLASKMLNMMGRRQLLTQSFIGSTIPLLLLGAFPEASPVAVLVLFSVYAICIGGTQVLLFVYPTELFPTSIRASALGVGTSFSKLGAAVGIYLVPMSVASFGISPTMYAAAAISLIGLIATVLMAPETRSNGLMKTA